MDRTQLCLDWIAAKQAEAQAIDRRREIEDELVEMLAIDTHSDGTSNILLDNFKIKVVSRLNRKVDAEKVQEIAAECGLTEHLSSLFRWKPEINLTAWKAADVGITTPLLDAVTTTASRPSFSISLEQ